MILRQTQLPKLGKDNGWGSLPPNNCNYKPRRFPTMLKGIQHFFLVAICLLGTLALSAQSNCGNDCYVFTGNIGYKAIGNSMNYSEARDNCNKKSSSSASLSIPSGATVSRAYLQWSGSGSVDSRVSLNGHTVNANKTFTDNNGSQYYFGAYADVTNLVQSGGTYRVSNLSWSNSSTYCQPNSAYGAWSLVVIYERSNLENCTIHLCQDNFRFTFPEGTYNSSIGCVDASECTSDAELTIITFESDDYKGEYLYIGGQYYGDNNFRGRTAPNLDIYTANVSNHINQNTSSLGYAIRSYRTNTVWGLAIEGLFDFVKVLKYNNCPPDPCASRGGDSDGDGLCDNDDCRPNNPNLPTTPGTACNDGDPNTVNDRIQANGCDCAGTFDACATSGGDSDGDGVCDNDDCRPNNPNLPTTPGTACNDGDPNTINDRIQANGCDCAGTFDACATSGGDSDGDGVCDNDDCRPNNPNLPMTPGSACNDGNPNTVNDKIQGDGCTCAGTFDACATNGGDSDGDGVCDNDDCQPNNPNFPATPGTACNDGNPNTTDDKVTADGCGCQGTPVGNTPDCDTDITITTTDGTINITGLDAAPIASVQVFNASWNKEFSCFADCGASQSISVAAGTYQVYVKLYEANYQLICEREESVTVSGGAGPCDGQGGDSDGDGVCNNDDCQPNNPNFPATPGTACNDGNPNTTDDKVTADGCGCQGTPTGNAPDCDTDITITTTDGTINITGLDAAPISSVQVFNASWNKEFSCFADCGASQSISVAAGTYQVYVKLYEANYQLICEREESVTVGGSTGPCDGQGGDSDGDGVCDNDDCQPNNPAFPATPGTACNDGNPNTTNDQVTADGCGCQGTVTTGPCDGQGGDSDGDGVCDNDDCQPNNPAFPATPGTACNDGNPNTVDDKVTADGCGCAGTPDNNGNPDCNDIVYEGGDKITVSNLTAPITIVKVFNSGWQEVAGCSNNCSEMEMYNVPAGTYYVTVQYFTAVWQPICKKEDYVTVTGGSNPCDGQGGDSDGDGVCDNADCQPNNANFPATPGSACNDGNPNTSNDQVTADSCGCAGTVTDPCASRGGDSDGDGVCDNDDCQPNNANFPATPGSACNDGDSSTENDQVTADGCGCTGTPTGPEIETCGNDCFVFEGKVDYTVIGNSMSYSEDRNDCRQKSSSSAQLNVPNGGIIEKVYLHWSGSGSLDNRISLNGQNVSAQKTYTQNTAVGYFFGAYADVTNLVNGGGSYRVSNLSWSNANAFCQSNAAYGAWSMVVVYRTNAAENCRIHVCQDKFKFTYPEGTYRSSIDCVEAENATDAKLTIVTFEGDDYKGEELTIGGRSYGDNNFRGQTAPNLDIATFNVSNVLDGNSSSLDYSIRSYRTNTVFGPAIEGLFDFVKVLKYNVGGGNTGGGGSNLTVSCPNNISVMQNATNGRQVYWNAPTANTTCNGGVNIVQTAGPASGSTFPVGTTQVSYRISDACGSARICSFNVTVMEDNNAGGGGNDYCAASGSNPWVHWIRNVRIGSINQTSNKEGYADFTDVTTNAQHGNDVAINLTAGFSYTRFNMHWQIFIDWNRDGDFDDADESVFRTASSEDNVSGSISVPNHALGGSTCIRVVCQRDEYGDACGTFGNGEVEDYTMVIANSHPTPFAADNNNAVGINIYPNPAQANVNIDLTPYADEAVDVIILDNAGRVVLHRHFDYASTGATELDVQQLAAGMYFVKVQTATTQHTEKLMISRR